MEEFVNWDQAEPASASGVEMPSQCLVPSGQPLDDLDLALENANGDEFSFWALQHFENNVSPAIGNLDEEIPMPTDRSTRTFEDHLETPEAPCAHCQLGGYECKRIPEGQYKGYCTSCVALHCACSFGLDPVFPSNPWPVMGDHPRLVHEDLHFEPLRSASATDLPESASVAERPSANPGPRGKAGARFSRESVKILKNWLSTHNKHPYPNDEEKEMLQKQTGLSKTQITNWLANTRRRNKNAVGHRSTSPGVRSWANPIDIPQRRGTPASFEHMNPLQRWAHSPPENEPASVTAIARAINSTSSLSSGLNSPYSANFTDDGSGRSLCDSAISSANTSHSSTSVYSFGSRGSFGSAGSSIHRGRRRRRRKALAAGNHAHQSGPPKTYQCTFCTETFRTKHDWQRHEKSLHLSLERWVCSPNGAQAFNPENGQMSCVFCGEANPDEAHIDSHNYSACQERTVGERTFYRKDHLRQHLKLVHDAKYMSWSMEQWKATTPEIRSRCGFCDAILDTWSLRVDHLAEHFKKGKSMADWKGGWGFDAPVLDMVENSIPPYLIHDERNSPNPYEASRPSVASARNAFELIKSELTFYIDNWREKEGKEPSDEELQRTACAMIYDSDEVAEASESSSQSWFRDLLFSSDRLAQEARWTKVRGVDHWQQLKINGKGNIFELDPMEAKLQEYVKGRRLLGLTAMDCELQAEACNIIRRMEAMSNFPSNEVTEFLIRLVNSSRAWLAGFRQRAHLPRSEDMADERKRSKDPSTIDSTIHNPSRLENELAEFVQQQRALGIEPTDADLQQQARLIIYELNDGWNQTAADDPLWLATFKQRHGLAGAGGGAMCSSAQLPSTLDGCYRPISATDRSTCGGTTSPCSSGSGSGASLNATGAVGTWPPKAGAYYLNDASCYKRLERELKKYVASTMSPNNPNCHVPSDEELQHQARWIVYEDDDPWNQTAADNAEWLRRFKRDVGLLNDPTLPGLTDSITWNIRQGGSGFAPPYVFPNPQKMAAQEITAFSVQEAADNNRNLPMSGMTSETGANQGGVCQVLACEPPPAVFCSRELEKELSEFVTGQVVMLGRAGFPSDAAIRQRARAFWNSISAHAGEERTPADDDVLLGKFKDMMRVRLGLSEPSPSQRANQNTLNGGERGQQQQQGGQMGQLSLETGAGLGGIVEMDCPNLSSTGGLGAITEMACPGVGVGMSEGEINNMLQEMDFDFGNMEDFLGIATGGMAMDQL
ncbi:hypothetical protein C8A03DRAFT_16478 [Achaetomium macrosporum]|uniref:Uncharacterized protein n=1 Tax=Achaetomium macrosporum TaxID=79813 RepID=A0AAN7C7Q5_9PEZI|nr:hypothetical protein C8A03DRAFT_16478 [Achaetomium macrosporum]